MGGKQKKKSATHDKLGDGWEHKEGAQGGQQRGWGGGGVFTRPRGMEHRMTRADWAGKDLEGDRVGV